MESTEEILDTIEVCQSYISDAQANSGGVFAHLFDPSAVSFAHRQIEFERAKLAALGK